jgi:hypothetical protein
MRIYGKELSVIQICECCHDIVSNYSYECCALLEIACDAYSLGKFFAVLDVRSFSDENKSLFKALRFLERKGYLISTEMSEKILVVVPNVTKALFHEDVICWCRVGNKG